MERNISHEALTNSFGISIKSINLQEATLDIYKELKMLLAQHGLILLKNQCLSDTNLINIGKSIGNGNLEESARKVSLGEEDSRIAYLTNLRDVDGQHIGFPGSHTDYWHSDQEFREIPASIGMLYCVIPTAQGGETSFASTLVNNINSNSFDLNILRQLWSTRRPARSHDNAPDFTVAHPVIVTNKITRRESVYLSENTIDFIPEGVVNSAHLKNKLLNLIINEKNKYSHDWKMGDLIIYDNSQLLHRREEFQGKRLLKALKVFPDGYYIESPEGYCVNDNLEVPNDY